MRSITENTKISLTVLGMILAGYGYAITLSFKADAAASDISELKQDRKTIQEMAGDIKEIKADLNWLKRRSSEPLRH